jgi:CRP-like cAMP-binding protein
MLESLLLQALSNTDIDWLLNAGKVQEYAPDHALIHPRKYVNQAYFLLNGQLSIAMPYQEWENLMELAKLGRDTFVGRIPYLENFLPTATIHTQTSCRFLAIDQEQLSEKLVRDVDFAAHFYQLQTRLLLHRIRAVIMQAKLNPTVLYQINLKEASSLFAELQDSHLDWFIAVGQWHQLQEGDVLQQVYRPIEFLHIVLDGALSLSFPDGADNDLPGVFLPNSAEQIQATLQETARIARGDVFGEMQLIPGINSIALQTVQVRAVRDTEVLSIPRWRILSKLIHDSGFALHFYRVLAILLASKYQSILAELGFLTQPETSATDSDRLLTQMARAETHFEWMVQRIQTKVITGRNR